jgi:hypothetical protein
MLRLLAAAQVQRGRDVAVTNLNRNVSLGQGGQC